MSWRRVLRRTGAALAIGSLIALFLAGALPGLAQEQPPGPAMDEEAMPGDAMPADAMPATEGMEPGVVETEALEGEASMPAEPAMDPEAAMPAETEMAPGAIPNKSMEGEAAQQAEAMPQDAMPEDGDAALDMAPEPGMEKEMMEEAPAAVELAEPKDVPIDEEMGGEEAMMEEKALEMAPPAPPPPVAVPEPRGPAQLEIGTQYKGPGYRQVTGLILSEAHGRRLVRTYVSPPASAKIYRQNAAKVRQGIAEGLQRFPVGTVIVQESYARTRTGTPGKPGPLFVMKKESPGYDSSGNDWRYAFAQPDLTLIGDGTRGPVESCKACHTKVRDRDYVMAMDR